MFRFLNRIRGLEPLNLATVGPIEDNLAFVKIFLTGGMPHDLSCNYLKINTFTVVDFVLYQNRQR